jgi:plastocyanin
MRAPAAAVALVAAVGGALLAPSVPLAEEPPAPPTAVLEADATTVEAGKALKLDSSKSSAGATPIVGHVWDLDGNGSFETDTGVEPTTEVKPAKAGELTVAVRVVDEGGQNSDAKLDLTVTEPAKPAMVAAPVVVEPKSPAASSENGGNEGKDGEKAAGPKAPDAAAPAAEEPAPDAAPPTAAAEPMPSEPAPPAAPSLTPVRMAAAPALVPRRALARASAQGDTEPVADVHAAGSQGVTIKDFKYAPASISVSVGDSITWTNQDIAPHTATASDGSFDTGSLSKGKSGTVTLSKAGTFAYICSIHPSMKGTVTVAAASGASGGGTGDDTGSGGTSNDAGSADSGSGLPQTGLNLMAVVLLASLMMGSGSLLRRRVR